MKGHEEQAAEAGGEGSVTTAVTMSTRICEKSIKSASSMRLRLSAKMTDGRRVKLPRTRQVSRTISGLSWKRQSETRNDSAVSTFSRRDRVFVSTVLPAA